jgi:hypothetical protein
VRISTSFETEPRSRHVTEWLGYLQDSAERQPFRASTVRVTCRRRAIVREERRRPSGYPIDQGRRNIRRSASPTRTSGTNITVAGSGVITAVKVFDVWILFVPVVSAKVMFVNGSFRME